MKPVKLWALLTHMGTLALGAYSELLVYKSRKAAAYDCSRADGERVVKIEITEVTK